MVLRKSSKHLENVHMDYFEHFCLSMYFSGTLLIGSAQAFIHAWVPCWFSSSTGSLVNHISIIIHNVVCEKSK
jgi:hypothetical protein